MGRVTRSRVIGVLAALGVGGAAGVVPASIHAQDTVRDAGALLGAWEMERETPRGTMTARFTFAQEGDSVVVHVGEGETAVAAGRAEIEGGVVSFPLDMRALMSAMRDREGGPPRAGRRGEGPPRAGQGRLGPEGGPPRGAMAESPRFTGTLEGDEIRGTFAGPRGEQEVVLRRVGAGG